jgi:hypothetical protein
MKTKKSRRIKDGNYLGPAIHLKSVWEEEPEIRTFSAAQLSQMAQTFKRWASELNGLFGLLKSKLLKTKYGKFPLANQNN